MPISDSLMNVSGRLEHAFDFAFHKNSGEIANQIRSELTASPQQFSLINISLDEDGDIDVQTNVGRLFLGPAGVFSVGRPYQSGKFLEESSIHFCSAVDWLFKIKGTFAIERCSVRVLFRFNLAPNGLDELRSRVLVDPVLKSMLAENASSGMNSFHCSFEFTKDGFSDSVELKATKDEVQFWYERKGTGFDSYVEFFHSARLSSLVSNVAPFLETLAANEPPRGLRLGRSKIAPPGF